MRWVLGLLAAAAVAGYTFTYVAVRSLLDEDWYPVESEWDE